MKFKTKIEEQDIKDIVSSEYINWNYFKNSVIMVTGSTGMIGEQIVKSILLANEQKNTNIKIIALIRNKKKARDKFGAFFLSKSKLKYIVQDITKPIKYRGKIDFIIHTANTTSSKTMTEQPVETINSIVEGTKNVLEFAKTKKIKSMVYISSMEVYGKIDFEKVEPLKENDYGYIDILKARNSYPEGKRLAECMCFAYANEYRIPVKIARLCQTIGANVDYNDGRVFAEFARCICEERDIILKTYGKTTRSYAYITDAISAILTIAERGKNGESYNIANPDTTCSIKEMVEMLCEKYTCSHLKFEINDIYYPEPSKLYLNISKIQALNWQPKIDLDTAYSRIIQNFKDTQKLYTKKFKNNN